MEVKITQIKKCRACKGTNLKRCLSLKNMPLTDDLRTHQNQGSEFLHDIDVFRCVDCGLTQTLNEVDLTNYYNEYSYTSSNSNFTKDFMKTLASKLFSEYHFDAESKVVEIGSGDGAQLSFFKLLGAKVHGVEPSAGLCEKSRNNGIPVFHGFFEKGMFGYLPKEIMPANIILLTYTFDHMPNPVEILNLAREIIDPVTGVLAIEVHDLDKIIDRNEYCLFAHEHYVYMTKNTMTQLLKMCSFEPITYDILPDTQKRGNSLLVIAKPIENVNKQLKLVEETDQFQMQENIDNAIMNINKFIEDAVSNGKTIAGYGAGGRGVMSLATLQKPQNIKYVCDQNVTFHGYYTPKSNIKIVSPEMLKIEPVDILLVFSFGYINEIKMQVSEYNSDMEIISILDVMK